MSRLSPAITTSYLGQHGEIALWRKREGYMEMEKERFIPLRKRGAELKLRRTCELKSASHFEAKCRVRGYENTRMRGFEDSRILPASVCHFRRQLQYPKRGGFGWSWLVFREEEVNAGCPVGVACVGPV